MLSTLYNVEINTINYHIKKIYNDSELTEDSTIRKFRIVQKEGNREVAVNSIHTMFANEDDIKNLDISAYSEDGYVEAIELKDKKFCLGVKWHPELMIDDKNMNGIFRYFIEVYKRK